MVVTSKYLLLSSKEWASIAPNILTPAYEVEFLPDNKLIDDFVIQTFVNKHGEQTGVVLEFSKYHLEHRNVSMDNGLVLLLSAPGVGKTTLLYNIKAVLDVSDNALSTGYMFWGEPDDSRFMTPGANVSLWKGMAAYINTNHLFIILDSLTELTFGSGGDTQPGGYPRDIERRFTLLDLVCRMLQCRLFASVRLPWNNPVWQHNLFGLAQQVVYLDNTKGYFLRDRATHSYYSISRDKSKTLASALINNEMIELEPTNYNRFFTPNMTSSFAFRTNIGGTDVL